MTRSPSPEPVSVPGTRFRVLHVPETGSTNADLLAAASAGEPAGLVLVADHQTAGRGRLDRHWTSAPGASLLVSVLLDPAAPEEMAQLVGCVALSLSDALHAIADVRPEVKWPNDLVVADRKLAGVLAEVAYRGSDAVAVVVGAGCNLRDAAIAGADRPTATSVEEIAGAACDRDALLDVFVHRLEYWLDSRSAVHAEVCARSATLGRRVAVECLDEYFVGVADALEPDGALRIVGDDGIEREIRVGDVVHLRHHSPE
ncbi:MAG: biotin--[acetyl-CoA-carboxylase] ligase [Acidimicrobiia bacterium]